MTAQKCQLATPAESQFPKKIDDSKIIPSIVGKKVVFITDERDIASESMITPFILSSIGARESSGSEAYPNFFNKSLEADVIILRSSRLFTSNLDLLLSALQKFRRENPHSCVIVCAYDGKVFSQLEPLKENGIINHLTSNPPNDLELVKLGTDFLGKSRSF